MQPGTVTPTAMVNGPDAKLPHKKYLKNGGRVGKKKYIFMYGNGYVYDK